jgi:hypothetical protein
VESKFFENKSLDRHNLYVSIFDSFLHPSVFNNNYNNIRAKPIFKLKGMGGGGEALMY